ncbi:MAG: hypothetical protein ABIF10_04420 [Candidatus Woesearchaeota archaeon]
MKPLAEIADIYGLGNDRDLQIYIRYDVNEQERDTAVRLKEQLEYIIQDKRETLGVAHIRPIKLSSEQAESLRKNIKADKKWVNAYSEVVETFAPHMISTNLQDQLASIRIPWWNANLLFRNNDLYDDSKGSLDIDASISHSYITQLMRSQKLRQKSLDSISISNILVTQDDLIVLGWRAGHTYSNTLMTVPAGSVEYHSGKNPLFETLWAEHFEELGLSKKEFTSTKLIGRVFDNTLSSNSLYVFYSKLGISFADLLKKWRRSSDQSEHKHLLAFNADQRIILDEVMTNGYNPTKADPDKPQSTTEPNIGSILPPAAASLLLYCYHKQNPAWARKAQEMLNNAYVFSKKALT